MAVGGGGGGGGCESYTESVDKTQQEGLHGVRTMFAITVLEYHPETLSILACVVIRRLCAGDCRPTIRLGSGLSSVAELGSIICRQCVHMYEGSSGTPRTLRQHDVTGHLHRDLMMWFWVVQKYLEYESVFSPTYRVRHDLSEITDFLRVRIRC